MMKPPVLKQKQNGAQTNLLLGALTTAQRVLQISLGVVTVRQTALKLEQTGAKAGAV